LSSDKAICNIAFAPCGIAPSNNILVGTSSKFVYPLPSSNKSSGSAENCSNIAVTLLVNIPPKLIIELNS
jgi:hypothetical protein